MNSLARIAALSVCLVAGVPGAGCKKAVEDPTVVQGAANLPGATNVWAAIDKKNYDGAMAALLKIRESCTTEEQNIQYMVLARQVRDKMSEAAATSPAAAQAANALRAMSVGGR